MCTSAKTASLFMTRVRILRVLRPLCAGDVVCFREAGIERSPRTRRHRDARQRDGQIHEPGREFSGAGGRAVRCEAAITGAPHGRSQPVRCAARPETPADSGSVQPQAALSPGSDNPWIRCRCRRQDFPALPDWSDRQGRDRQPQARRLRGGGAPRVRRRFCARELASCPARALLRDPAAPPLFPPRCTTPTGPRCYLRCPEVTDFS